MRRIHAWLSGLLVGFGLPLFVLAMVFIFYLAGVSPHTPDSATGQVVPSLYKGEILFMRPWESAVFSHIDYFITPYGALLVLYIPLTLLYRVFKGRWPDDEPQGRRMG